MEGGREEDLACSASHLMTSLQASSLFLLWMDMMCFMSSCFSSSSDHLQPSREERKKELNKNTLTQVLSIHIIRNSLSSCDQNSNKNGTLVHFEPLCPVKC